MIFVYYLNHFYGGRTNISQMVCGFFLFLFLMFIFERERDRVQAREGQRERETQNPKQDTGSQLSAQSPTRGSNSWTARSWPEPKPDAQPSEMPRHPYFFFFKYCCSAYFFSNKIYYSFYSVARSWQNFIFYENINKLQVQWCSLAFLELFLQLVANQERRKMQGIKNFEHCSPQSHILVAEIYQIGFIIF